MSRYSGRHVDSAGPKATILVSIVTAALALIGVGYAASRPFDPSAAATPASSGAALAAMGGAACSDPVGVATGSGLAAALRSAADGYNASPDRAGCPVTVVERTDSQVAGGKIDDIAGWVPADATSFARVEPATKSALQGEPKTFA